jgi:very-short-patch-repair endonuclease
MDTNGMHKGAEGILFKFAKEMRRAPTSAEKIMWLNLRNRKLGGHKFRRQHPIQNYIADFYCHERRLVIELDGGIHLTYDQYVRDEERSQKLKEFGIAVMRISNQEVLTNLPQVLRKILVHLDSVQPSPRGEG